MDTTYEYKPITANQIYYIYAPLRKFHPSLPSVKEYCGPSIKTPFFITHPLL